MTIKTQLQKLKQVRRKVKHTIKAKYRQLENIELQIDSLKEEVCCLANCSQEKDPDDEVDTR